MFQKSVFYGLFLCYNLCIGSDNMGYDIVFESERIYFVKLTENLVIDYLNMVNDIEVQKFISHKRRVYTLLEEKKWINEKINNNAIIFSMIEKETDDFIGNIEIMRIKNNIGEVGIAITPSKQDKHFGQEGIKRLVDYSFKQLNLDGLELNVYDFNLKAIKCYEKIGFVRDGICNTEEDIHMILMK